MLPESMMADEEELRAWLSRAFQAAMTLPPKSAKTPSPSKRPRAKNASATAKTAAKAKPKTTKKRSATRRSPKRARR